MTVRQRDPMMTTLRVPTVWTRPLQLTVAVGSLITIIGTAIVLGYVTPEVLSANSPDLAMDQIECSMLGGSLLGYRIIGLISLIANTVGPLALTGWTWVFYFVLDVFQGIGFRYVDRAAVGLNDLGNVGSILADGGGGLLALVMIGFLIRYRAARVRSVGLFYVTGAPGAGKTTLRSELSDRGWEARDLDNSGLGGPHNKRTGERVRFPPSEERSPDWFEAHEWRTYPDAFERLHAESASQDIILCGGAATDSEVLHLFDKILYLRLDDDTLRHRIAARSDDYEGGGYGKNPFELEEIIRRKHALDLKYSALDVIEIDATGSIGDVADEIVWRIRQGRD